MGKESWIQVLEFQRKGSNNIWPQNLPKCHTVVLTDEQCVCGRICMRSGPAIQVTVLKGKVDTALFFRHKALKNLKPYFQKRWPKNVYTNFFTIMPISQGRQCKDISQG